MDAFCYCRFSIIAQFHYVDAFILVFVDVLINVCFTYVQRC